MKKLGMILTLVGGLWLMRLFFYFFSYSFSPVFAESALLRAL